MRDGAGQCVEQKKSRRVHRCGGGGSGKKIESQTHRAVVH